MMFSASINNVFDMYISPSCTDDDWSWRTGSHLDSFICYFARVRSGDPRIHEPPKLLPPVMVFIELGIRGDEHAWIRYRRGRRRGRSDGLSPTVLNRSQYRFSVAHERKESWVLAGTSDWFVAEERYWCGHERGTAADFRSNERKMRPTRC